MTKTDDAADAGRAVLADLERMRQQGRDAAADQARQQRREYAAAYGVTFNDAVGSAVERDTAAAETAPATRKTKTSK